MGSNSKLEETIDKILTQSESDLLSSLNTAHSESVEKLIQSQSSLDEEYDRILDEGRKEAEKIAKQIIGSSDLKARNKQLMLVQESIEKVFEKAIEKIKSTEHNENYSKLITTLIEESIQALGTSDVIISTNSKDKEIVQSVLAKFTGVEQSSDTIECLGGVHVKSKDGTMAYDNTIDSRIERMKPLIRKEIATKFGIGS